MAQPDRKQRRRRGRALIVAAVGATVLLSAGAAALVASREAPGLEPRRAAIAAGVAPAGIARRETRPTLDPAGFTGKAARAYQVAREIPEILDQLHCYCSCGREYGHVSLLSCYVDGHGST